MIVIGKRPDHPIAVSPVSTGKRQRSRILLEAFVVIDECFLAVVEVELVRPGPGQFLLQIPDERRAGDGP